jgi:flavin reductase (DIM6/NTAB) family NADH-FMN oxidoreductase RutF
MTVNPAAFRAALARVPTAVSVVTTVDASGESRGVTVGTLCSLSCSPPLVMFCLDCGNTSHAVFTATTRFLIQVLRDHQRDVANWFAHHGTHHFDTPHATSHGLPLIPDALARLLCTRHALVQGGDHTIVIGQVDDTEIGDGQPLLYYEREYHALALPGIDLTAPAMSAARANARRAELSRGRASAGADNGPAKHPAAPDFGWNLPKENRCPPTTMLSGPGQELS